MNIQPKTITTETETTLTELTVLRTVDEPTSKRLTVVLRASPQFLTVKVEDADYDTLGQWTDSSLNTFLVNKFGLTAI